METIWDDIQKKAGDVASAVGKGASKLTDLAKVKYLIATKQGKLEKIFESIGSLKYDEIKNGTDNEETINALLGDAGDLDAEIEELKAAYSEKSGARTCKACGKKLAKDSKFCPNCGEAVED